MTIMVAVATLIGFVVLIGGLLLVHRSVSVDAYFANTPSLDNKGAIAMGQGDTSPNIWTGLQYHECHPLFEESCRRLYSIHINVELRILCNVLTVCMEYGTL